MNAKYGIKLRVFAGILFAVFCVAIILPICLSNVNSNQKTQMTLQQIMEKERPVIESMGSFDATTGKLNIEDYADFIEFRDAVNNGTTFAGQTIKLVNDIDASQKNETQYPIGRKTSSSTRYFKGTFDGNGHSISGVKLKSHSTNNTSNMGLFGYIEDATIKNLSVIVKSINVTLKNSCGAGLVGSMKGKCSLSDILVLPQDSNSKIYCNGVNGSVTLAGVVGWCDGTSFKLERCANLVPISNVTLSTARVGGVMGYCKVTASSTISECYNSGSLNCGGSSSTLVYEGGIVAEIADSNNNITISHSLAKGSLTANSKRTTVNNAKGPITGVLRDKNDIKVEYGIITKTTSNTYNNLYVGGLVGYSGSCKINCCVNATAPENTSVPQTEQVDTLTYIFATKGYGGMSLDSVYEIQPGWEQVMDSYLVSNTSTYFGDIITANITQKQNRLREIGHGNFKYQNNPSSVFSYVYNDSGNGYSYTMNLKACGLVAHSKLKKYTISNGLSAEAIGFSELLNANTNSTYFMWNNSALKENGTRGEYVNFTLGATNTSKAYVFNGKTFAYYDTVQGDQKWRSGDLLIVFSDKDDIDSYKTMSDVAVYERGDIVDSIGGVMLARGIDTGKNNVALFTKTDLLKSSPSTLAGFTSYYPTTTPQYSMANNYIDQSYETLSWTDGSLTTTAKELYFMSYTNTNTSTNKNVKTCMLNELFLDQGNTSKWANNYRGWGGIGGFAPTTYAQALHGCEYIFSAYKTSDNKNKFNLKMNYSYNHRKTNFDWAVESNSISLIDIDMLAGGETNKSEAPYLNNYENAAKHHNAYKAGAWFHDSNGVGLSWMYWNKNYAKPK